MSHPHPKYRRAGRHLSHLSFFLLSLLLGGTGTGYAAGPTFSSDIKLETTTPQVWLAGVVDWMLINDRSFSIEWIENGTAIPLSIEVNARHHALYIDETGKVGLGTGTPQQELHIVNSDAMPSILLEDTTGTPYKWTLSASSAGFDVVDSTAGRVVFGIDPGAPNSTLRMDSKGDVGVGTVAPQEAVDVVRTGASRFQLSSFSNDPSDAAQFIQRRARGTQDAPSAARQGDNIGLFSFRGMRPNGNFSGSRATLTAQATQDWTNSAQGTRLLFGTTPNGTSIVQTIMEITHDGRVLINGSQLSVPDYVFADDYELMPLDDLKAYISHHQHLPDVANEAEVKQGGVDLTATQMALLKKVEELTLYTIDQHEQLIALRQDKAALQQRVAAKDKELAAKDRALEQRVARLERQLRTNRREKNL